MKSYLHFEEVTMPGKKTKTWLVRNVQKQELLGVVKWLPHWRKYGYETIKAAYDDNCMAELVVFLRARMAEHCVNKKKAEKARF